MEVDWDLGAVVRGCATISTATSTTTTTTTTTPTSIVEDPFSCFAPLSYEQDNYQLCFPELCETRMGGFDELEQLYKPFFPKFQSLSPQTVPSSISPSFGGLRELQQQLPQQQQQQQQQKLQHQRSSLSGSATAAAVTHLQAPRSKKRKNQQKRVVCQVPAEGLSSDVWAWRKYGQKPIKGSPHPRGYYRCSSSKGCPARKQVERSRTDPAMFIITYTAEHNHPVPTHRNSLAGSTRQKFSTPQPVSNTDATDTPTSKPSYSSSSPTSTAGLSGLSPTTPLTASMEDQSKQDEELEVDQMMVEEDDDILIPNIIMNDDLFMGLDELAGPSNATGSVTTPNFDDCFSDHFPANFPPTWLGNNATTAAGGS